MKNNELKITVSGVAGSGKSIMILSLLGFLIESGFEVSVDNTVDAEEAANRVLNKNVNFKELINTTKVVFSEKILQDGSP